MLKQFGAKPTKDNLKKYADSSQWNGKIFENIEPTTMAINLHDLPKLLYKQFCEKTGREPLKKIQVEPFNLKSFINTASTEFIWYGHSAVLMRLAGKNILIDPMFGTNAAPISPFPVKRFSNATLAIIDKLPEIDLVLFTHDHYDHLDYDSLKKLIPKVKQYYVALGIERHLIKWGVDKNLITEFDWWEQTKFGEINITFTPTRHFSGRGLTDRAKSLWGGWALKTNNENIWFSGDGGYGNHFKEIGEQLGPFNFAFMECGQYDEKWHLIHMYPEESVQAAIDAKVKKIIPVHWGGFALAQHPWTDPVNRFIKAAKKQGIPYLHPKIGELINYTKHTNIVWWEGNNL